MLSLASCDQIGITVDYLMRQSVIFDVHVNKFIGSQRNHIKQLPCLTFDTGT